LAALLAVAVPLMYVPDFIFFIPEQFRSLTQIRFITFITLYCFISLIVGAPKILAIILASWVILYGIFELLLPWFLEKEIPYLQRLQKRAVASNRTPTTLSTLVDKFGPNTVLTVFYAAATAWAAYWLGMQQARNQKDFLVIADNQEQVLLARYGDTLIFGEQDANSALQPKVIVRKMTDQSTTLIPEHIDHLVPIGGEKNGWW
jgi:hypothetical protein